MSGRRPRRARLFASPRRRVHASAVPDSLADIVASGSPLVAYESVLASSPLLTKCVTSGVGFAVADVVAQSLSGGFRDANRTAANAVFGLALYGPLSSAWYGALDALILPDSPNGAAAVAAKTALDQLLWAPVLVTGLFAWDMARKGEPLVVAREGREGNPETPRDPSSRSDLKSKLEDDLLDTLKVNWTFWPAFHVLNFRFVAPPDRILYINAVQVLYNVFLVLKAAKRGNAKDASAGE
jgi:protein Mpv17